MFVSVRQGTPDQRLNAWRDHLFEIFGPSQVHGVDRGAFRSGDIHVGDIGNLVVAQVSADPTVIVHTARAVAAAREPDFYKVKLQVSGCCLVEQQGTEAALKPGDLALFDARRPYRFAYQGSYRAVFVLLPPRLLPFSPRSLEQAGVVRVSGQQGLGAVVSAFLAQLGREVGSLDGQDAERLSGSIVNLLATTFAERLDRASVISPGTRGTALCRQAEQYVEQHLKDPDLGPAAIAAAYQVSTRYLHKVFEREGSTVAGLIRARRLEKIRGDLANPLLAGRPVCDVGARWGLVNPSQVSRLFRGAYGDSPQEYRTKAAETWTTVRRPS